MHALDAVASSPQLLLPAVLVPVRAGIAVHDDLGGFSHRRAGDRAAGGRQHSALHGAACDVRGDGGGQLFLCLLLRRAGGLCAGDSGPESHERALFVSDAAHGGRGLSPHRVRPAQPALWAPPDALAGLLPALLDRGRYHPRHRRHREDAPLHRSGDYVCHTCGGDGARGRDGDVHHFPGAGDVGTLADATFGDVGLPHVADGAPPLRGAAEAIREAHEPRAGGAGGDSRPQSLHPRGQRAARLQPRERPLPRPYARLGLRRRGLAACFLDTGRLFDDHRRLGRRAPGGRGRDHGRQHCGVHHLRGVDDVASCLAGPGGDNGAARQRLNGAPRIRLRRGAGHRRHRAHGRFHRTGRGGDFVRECLLPLRRGDLRAAFARRGGRWARGRERAGGAFGRRGGGPGGSLRQRAGDVGGDGRADRGGRAARGGRHGF